MEGVALPEPKTPERSSSSERDEHIEYSPKRGLRRIRGTVGSSPAAGAGGISHVSSSTTASTISNSSTTATVATARRNSTHLHHPKQLKSSPKSAYFEDGGLQTKKAGTGRVIEFAPAPIFPRPDSPPGGSSISFEGVPISRPISPPGSETSDDEDTEGGGALLYSNVPSVKDDEELEPSEGRKGKQRVLARSGKKVTPWATRASSFVSERPESPGLAELLQQPVAVAVESESESEREIESESENESVSEKKPSPPAVKEQIPAPPPLLGKIKPVNTEDAKIEPVETKTTTIITDKTNDVKPVTFSDIAPLKSLHIDHNDDPAIKPLKRSSTAETTSSHDVFEDAPEIPIESPPIPSEPAVITAQEVSVAAAKVILIFQPPDPTTAAASASSSSQPAKPLLPALNLIPATPQSLSSSAEKEKQLGHGLLSRRATGISQHSIPEDPAEEPQRPTSKKQQRPSLAGVLPEKVRHSKLHPWWRPKRATSSSGDEAEEDVEEETQDGGNLSHVLSAPSEHSSSFSEDHRTRRASTGIGKKGSGRIVKRIKGTRFVIEFVGWRKIGNVVMGKRKKNTSAAVKS
ncbi:hypothetical protein FN846DRAFT_379643 [Sphaerosporella brunnea]|uniref:Uncharacterized protein n=1 Tax=Sphaerosporella brunnea TaxID=1250544 RepID=A0A5J5F5F5_9PEZI|nr:hypothetical protein FN846DRAFT_379643 [Sphaerosporella brunnea]